MPTYSCPVPVSLPNRLRFQVSSFTSLQGMDIYKDKLCRGHIHIASPSAQRPGKPESYPVNSWLFTGCRELGRQTHGENTGQMGLTNLTTGKHTTFLLFIRAFIRGIWPTVEGAWILELMDLVLGSGAATYLLGVLEQVPSYLWVWFPYLNNVNLIKEFWRL